MSPKKKAATDKAVTKKILLIAFIALVLFVSAIGLLQSKRETVATKASEDNPCYKKAKTCFYKCSFLPQNNEDNTKAACEKACMSLYSTCRQEQEQPQVQGQTPAAYYRSNRTELSCPMKCYFKKADCKSQCEICAGPEGRGCSLCTIRNEDRCNKVCKNDYSACTASCSASSSSSSASTAP